MKAGREGGHIFLRKITHFLGGFGENRRVLPCRKRSLGVLTFRTRYVSDQIFLAVDLYLVSLYLTWQLCVGALLQQHWGPSASSRRRGARDSANLPGACAARSHVRCHAPPRYLVG